MRHVIRKLCRRGGFIAALAVVLLGAQAITVSHELDPADHGPGQVCEACLAASHLAGANVTAPALPATVTLRQTVDAEYRSVLVSRWPSRFRARAPPLAS